MMMMMTVTVYKDEQQRSMVTPTLVPAQQQQRLATENLTLGMKGLTKSMLKRHKGDNCIDYGGHPEYPASSFHYISTCT